MNITARAMRVSDLSKRSSTSNSRPTAPPEGAGYASVSIRLASLTRHSASLTAVRRGYEASVRRAAAFRATFASSAMPKDRESRTGTADRQEAVKR
jgi:hypothetical protein